MFTLFKRKPVAEIHIIQRDPCRLRLSEWRASPTLVGQARAVLSTPEFQQMMDVLRNEAVVEVGRMMPRTATFEERASKQAFCEGFQHAIGLIESFGELTRQQAHLESSYQPPEPDDLSRE